MIEPQEGSAVVKEALFRTIVEAREVLLRIQAALEMEGPKSDKELLKNTRELEAKLILFASMLRDILNQTTDRPRRTLIHDLNNILTGALARTGLIVPTKTQEKQMEMTTSIEGALAKITQHIRAALNEGVNEGQTLEGVWACVDDLKQLLPGDFEIGREFQLNFEPGFSLVMTRSHFARLLFNLADNAYKAGARKVFFTARLEGECLVIGMKDNGPGFNGVAPREASRRSRERSEANGNGLPICFDFCEKAGGSLGLVDEHDSTGAEWLISLPIREAILR